MKRVLAVLMCFFGCANASPSAEARLVTEGAVSIGVQRLDAAQTKLAELVASRGGSVSSTYEGGREATWVVRVPQARFREALTAVSALGEVSSLSSDSRDVTDEYYDGEAHLGAKQTEEQRLLRLLETSSTNLQDVLAVEKELSRVRGEVEVLQGKKKLLEAITSTSALRVTMMEERGRDLGAALSRSATALVQTVGTLAVVGAALVPWLGALLLCAAPVVLLRRRRRAH